MDVDHGDLDTLLALQLTVAWAGEALSKPPRLGWWRTDLVDVAGGGSLFQDLFPRTHRWASLEAVRQAATDIDRRARRQVAQQETVRTLFYWGFQLDEKLDERLADLKREGRLPEEALRLSFELNGEFDEAALVTCLTGGREPPPTRLVPGGRLLADDPAPAAAEQAKKLAAALIPFTPEYPMPFFRVGD
jgi:hypothetical protein